MTFKNLKDYQNNIFALLLEFDSFCKEHNIKYCLFFGSLLGSIRHQGFIPWDDDIDLAMSQKEYEKLISIQNKLPNHLLLQPQVTSNKKKIPPKIIIKNSSIKTSNGIEKIWIDIFPLHSLSESQKKKLELCDALKMVWENRNNIKKQSFALYFLYKIAFKPFIIWERNLRKSTIREIIKNQTSEGPYVSYLFNDSSNHKIYPWDDFYPFSNNKFENMLFPTPKNPDPILRIEYSDKYLTPIKTHTHIITDDHI